MVHECSNCGHDGRYAPRKKVVCPNCDTIMKNLEKHLLNSHTLYTKADFTKEEAERRNIIYVKVVEEGLQLCKRCGKQGRELVSKCK